MLIALCLGAPERVGDSQAYVPQGPSWVALWGYVIGAFAWQHLADLFFTYVPGFTPDIFARMQTQYEAYGAWIVFAAGFSPIPYKIFTITSGVMQQNFAVFMVASLVGRAGRFFLVAGLLRRFGEPMREHIDKHFNKLALAFVALLLLGFLVVRWVF